MRFVVLRKSEKWMESGEPPDPELVAAMQRYDDEMRRAGVLVAVERLQPSTNATRLHLTGGKSHPWTAPSRRPASSSRASTSWRSLRRKRPSHG